MSETRSRRRTVEGVVVSDKMDQTVVVRSDRLTRHALYGKVIKRASRFKAHDAENQCRQGDVVRIAECRPLSKEKHWRVVEILSHEK